MKIIKYADDTVVVGLIENDNESEYRSAIKFVSEWCNNNFLNLNVNKTKELVIDFRRKKNKKILSRLMAVLLLLYKSINI